MVRSRKRGAGRLVMSPRAGFRGVEFGSEVVANCGKDAVLAAKESAGVEVVNMSTPYGS